MDKKDKKSKGGLEFVPLPPGTNEEDFRVPRGRRHPRQVSFTDVLDAKPEGKSGN